MCSCGLKSHIVTTDTHTRATELPSSPAGPRGAGGVDNHGVGPPVPPVMSLDGPADGDVRGAVTHGAVPPRDTNNAQRSSSNNSKPKSQRKRRRFGSGQPRLNEPLLAGYHSDGASASTGNGGSTGYGYGGSTGYANGYANGGSTGYGVSGPLPPVPRPALSNRPRDDNALARSAPLPSQRLMSPRRAASSGAPARSADNRSDNSAELYNSSRSVPENRSPFTPDNHDTMYHKLKYYSNLQKMAESARAQHDPDASPMPRWKPQLLPPPHVLPAYCTCVAHSGSCAAPRADVVR